MSVIAAEHLTKRFGKKVLAVDDASFSIEPGTITGAVSYTHLTLPTIYSV